VSRLRRRYPTLAARTVCAIVACAPLLSLADAPPVYHSRFPGASPARVGQASRGAGGQLRLVAVAPVGIGACATATPTLIWYLSAASARPYELVVQERGADVPLLEILQERDQGAGFHAVDLAKLDIALVPGREYEWSVALINDPKRRASDTFAKGAIQYVPGAPPLPPEPEEAAVRDRLGQGYWYDAVALLNAALEREPNASLTALRESVFSSERLELTP